MECKVIKCIPSENIKESAAQDAKHSLTAIHRRLQELKFDINLLGNDPSLPPEPIIPCSVKCPHNEPCIYRPKKKHYIDPCAENISLEDSFLFGSDLDKYTRNLSYLGPYNEGTNLLHKYRAHALSNEKCCKADPCSVCHIAVIRNLVNKIECHNKDQELNHLKCPYKKCDGNKCDTRCSKFEQKRNARSKFRMGVSKRDPKTFGFCSKYNTCKYTENDNDDENLPEPFLTNCCKPNPSPFQRRLWLTDLEANVIATIREKRLIELEDKIEEDFPLKCELVDIIRKQELAAEMARINDKRHNRLILTRVKKPRSACQKK